MERLLDDLGSGGEAAFAAARAFRELVGEELPSHLLRRYRQARKWQERVADVYFASLNDPRPGRDRRRPEGDEDRMREGGCAAYLAKPISTRTF